MAITEIGTRWYDLAECLGADVEIFFDKEYYTEAKRYCRNCPVINECLKEGLEQDKILGRGGPYGVYGGRTPEERIAIKRRKVA